MEKQNKSSKWSNNVKTEWLVNGTILKITINADQSSQKIPTIDIAVANHYTKKYLPNIYDSRPTFQQIEETATVLLAPMFGGIWTLCISLTGIIEIVTIDVDLINLIKGNGHNGAI